MKQSYDLIVAGGGPAGVAAAVAAARGGADTLLIEHTGCLGGMGTSGLVGAWCPFTDGKRLLHGGIGAEVVRRTTLAARLSGKHGNSARPHPVRP